MSEQRAQPIPGYIFNCGWCETTPRCKTPSEYIGRWLESPQTWIGNYPIRVTAKLCSWKWLNNCMSQLEYGAAIESVTANTFDEAKTVMAEMYYRHQDKSRVIIKAETSTP